MESLVYTSGERLSGGPVPPELGSGFGGHAGGRAAVRSRPRAAVRRVTLALPPCPLVAGSFWLLPGHPRGSEADGEGDEAMASGNVGVPAG